MSEFHLENVGPIKEFEFDLPECGICVIAGPNGAGKTTVLNTAEVLTNGRGNLTKREGTPGGEVRGLGKTLRVKQRTTQSGDLEVEGVGDLDVIDLHSPRFKDHAARDRHRIKTLCRLAGVEARIDDFRGLVDDDEFDRSVGEKAREQEDIVDMAAQVKRDLEKRSRDYSEQADRLTAEAKAKKEAFADVDLSVETDKEKLEAEHTAAIEQRAKVTQRRDSANTAKVRADEARSKLAHDEAAYTGPSVEDAEHAAAEAVKHESECEAEVERLKKLLAQAEFKHDKAVTAKNHAKSIFEAARRHEETVAHWRETIDAAENIDRPTDEEIMHASRRVTAAQEAVEKGWQAREAQAAMDAATELHAKAKARNDAAERLRTAAKETEAVLSAAIERLDNCPLRVWFDGNGDARLVTETGRGPNTLFDELSDGERWSLIIPLAMGQNRLVVLPQAAYGELQPAKRRLLHQLAVENRCVILTALADDGPLRAEAFDAETADETELVGAEA